MQLYAFKDTMNKDTKEYLKKTLLYRILLSSTYTLFSIMILMRESDSLFYLKNISNDIYFIRHSLLFIVFLNHVVYLIMLVKLRIAVSHNNSVDDLLWEKRKYAENTSTIPVLVFWISVIPIGLWSAIIVWEGKHILLIAAIYIFILLLLVIVTTIKFKRIRICLYGQNIIYEGIGILLIGCFTSLYSMQIELPQKSDYTTPIYISDIVVAVDSDELVRVKYHMTSNLASYTECELRAYGYFINYSIFQCDSEYIRNKVRIHNYNLERYQQIDKGGWNADSIFVGPKIIKDWEKYYIEYEDNIITIETNINLSENEIVILNKLLIDD